MLLTYQKIFPSLKSSLLQEHMIQPLDSQESNVHLTKRLKLRMQPDCVKNLPQFAILLVFQGSLLTKVWNNNEEVPNFLTLCLAYFKITVFYYILLSVFYLLFMAEKCPVFLKKRNPHFYAFLHKNVLLRSNIVIIRSSIRSEYFSVSDWLKPHA